MLRELFLGAEMNKSTRILSWALVPVSLGCLIWGGMELQNVSADRVYWEDKGAVQLAAGREQIEAGAEQLAAGKAQLADGLVAVGAGRAALADAKQQLAVGREQLEQFEAGQSEAMNGIDMVLATETYGYLASIQERLGADFRYADAEGNLDIEQGNVAVATAWGFLNDSTEAVTQDLTGRMIGAMAALVIGVGALVVSVVGWCRVR